MAERDLDGKVAVVTGAGGGIGREIVRRFVAEGAVVVAADLSEEMTATLGEEVGPAGRSVTLDVSEPASVAAVMDQALALQGHIDILINGAGVRSIGTVASHTDAEWAATIAVNLTGPFLCSRAVLPAMIERRGGSIVNIASTAGVIAPSTRAAYSVSKAGLIGLTKSLAQDFGQYGIRANALAPGVIETPMTASYFDDERTVEMISLHTALARWGQPREVADAAVFLGSDRSAYITGDVLAVDGGWLAGKAFTSLDGSGDDAGADATNNSNNER